jgi:hypothetical protein
MTHEYQPSVDDAWAQVKSKIREIAGDDEDKVLAIQKIVQSESDRRVQRAVDKFRSETLPQHVQKELDAMHSKKPEQVLAVKEKALEFSARTGMSYETVSRLLLGDGEPDDVLSALEEDINTVKINYVEEKLKIHGVNPPKAQPVWDGSLTRNDLKRMTPEQISKAMAGGRLDSMLRGGR